MSLTLPPGVSLSDLPALTPPTGVTPNFIDPVSRAHSVIVTFGVFTAVLLIFVALRMYAKLFITKSVGWEDAFCVMGTMISVGYVGLVSHVFHSGLGPHQWNVHLTVFLNETTIKELKAINYLYSPMMIFAKLSILLLFFRLFSVTKSFRIWIWIGIITTLINHVGGLILAIALCVPSDPIGYSKCAHTTSVLDVVISVINIISDFYILILPIFVISQLNMNSGRKIGLYTVFMTGLGACVASVVGLVYRVVQWHSDDTSWWLGPLLILSLLEVNMSLITGCMPLIPVIFRNENFTILSSVRSRLRAFRSSRSKRSDIDMDRGIALTAPSKEQDIDAFEARLKRNGNEREMEGKDYVQVLRAGPGLKSEPEELV